MIIKTINLVQPRHNYAPEFKSGKLGHIYMPTSLLAAASIFLHADIDVSITDENIEQLRVDNTIFGVNLLGAPYIPEVIKLSYRIQKEVGKEYQLILGGQTISGLKRNELDSLFSSKAINGNSYPELEAFLGIKQGTLPKIERLSLIPAYEKLAESNLKLYLSNEISFYLSQGCKHSCSFCAAHRTILDNETGVVIRAREVYRDNELALIDFEYLVQKAIQYEIQEIKVYLSNLDLFQNPLLLYNFALGIGDLMSNYPKIKIKLRGLSTSRSFLIAHKKNPEVIKKMIEVGLYQIGFGIDGATHKVYKETRKPQTVQESLSAIEICRKEYNITPEVLMVFGHNEKEDEQSLILALKFCEEMQESFKALPRPHVAKDVVPGNDGWNSSGNSKIVNKFLSSPQLFQNLDFTALPSPITHPVQKFRDLVAEYYKKVCLLPLSLTQYVLPELPDMTEEELTKIKEHNLERYDF